MCRPPIARQWRVFCLLVCRGTLFLLWSGLFLSPYPSWHALNGSNSTCLFWVVNHPSRTPPRKSLSRNLQNRFFLSPHHQTMPSESLTPQPHHALYWLGTGWWCLGIVRAFIPYMSKACLLSIHLPWSGGSPSMFFDLFVGCFLFSYSPQELGFIWWWALHFFGLLLGFPYFLQCHSVIPAVIIWSCWASFRPAIYSFSQWLGVATGLLLFMGSYVPFDFSLGPPWPVCFLWASSAFLLILHSPGLFTNFIRFPRPNNLILIFGVYGPAINPLLS